MNRRGCVPGTNVPIGAIVGGRPIRASHDPVEGVGVYIALVLAFLITAPVLVLSVICFLVYFSVKSIEAIIVMTEFVSKYLDQIEIGIGMAIGLSIWLVAYRAYRSRIARK